MRKEVLGARVVVRPFAQAAIMFVAAVVGAASIAVSVAVLWPHLHAAATCPPGYFRTSTWASGDVPQFQMGDHWCMQDLGGITVGHGVNLPPFAGAEDVFDTSQPLVTSVSSSHAAITAVAQNGTATIAVMNHAGDVLPLYSTHVAQTFNGDSPDSMCGADGVAARTGSDSVVCGPLPLTWAWAGSPECPPGLAIVGSVVTGASDRDYGLATCDRPPRVRCIAFVGCGPVAP